MFLGNLPAPGRRYRASVSAAILMVLIGCAFGLAARAQDTKPPEAAAQQQAPGAGGPQGDIGPYSVPVKKKEEPSPERSLAPKNPPGIGNFAVTKDVSLVSVPVMVATDKGQFVPNLKAANFQVSEDGVPQKISNFSTVQAPITAVLLIEFADIPEQFLYDTLSGAYAFTDTLKPEDWIAVVSYDIKPHILTDFTQDKTRVRAAIDQMRLPGFRDRNLFDALSDTIGRLQALEGRKYIVLITSGVDTFSKTSYDQLLKQIKGSKDISIFSISTGFAFRNWLETRHSFDANMRNMDYMQADSQLDVFAKMTGGRHYSPRFEGEFRGTFQDIGASIRNEYMLVYRPTNAKLDGTYRKLKVDVVDSQTGAPLKLLDRKGKARKYSVIAREGYTARHEVE